jgi:hypothetical protein
MIEQQSPPEMNAKTDTNPVVKDPTTIAMAARIDNTKSVLTGFSCP